MKMYDIEIDVAENGDVRIAQEIGIDDAMVILIHRDQVELICRWLKDAAANSIVKSASETHGLPMGYCEKS